MKKIYTLLLFFVITLPAMAQDVSIIKPDPTMTMPYSGAKYIEPFNVQSYQLNKNLPVGTTQSSWGVSSSGAVTYRIPIYTPPGTAGVQPGISIEYNSQGGDGLLGIGWQISGLSAITRVAKTYHQDSIPNPIRYTTEDEFALDGNRLINIYHRSGMGYPANCTSLVYNTERENFLKIESPFNTTSLGGPDHYIVQNTDGWELEYGNTNDSKRRLNNANEIYAWQLNKSTDPNGNYITYEYMTWYGESRIKRISYTGNSSAGIAPYNTMEFFYRNRQDKDTISVGKYDYHTYFLLDSIVVKSENALVRRYDFEYLYSDNKSHLASIKEYAGDGSMLNPINISWGNTPDRKENVYFSERIHINDKTFSGDFNGDGLSDLLIISDKVQYYLSSGLSGELPVRHNLNLKFDGAIVADIDNDGLDDVIFYNIVSHPYDIYEEYSFYPYFSRVEENMFFASTLGQDIPASTSSVISMEKCLVGDFDGSGRRKILRLINTHNQHRDDSLNLSVFYFERQADGSVIKYEEGSQGFLNLNKTKYEVFDFDGDGKDELVLGTDFYQYKNGRFTKKAELVLTKPVVGALTTNMYPGDLDGDGTLELVVHKNFINYQTMQHVGAYWYIYKYTESGYVPYTVDLPTAYVGMSLADLDGDGKAEIIFTDTNNYIKIYNYNFRGGYLTDRESSLRRHPTVLGDYNGDGNMDIFDGSNIYSLKKNNKQHLMHAVTNGLGQTTYFEYKPLTDTSVYKKANTALYPLLDMKSGMYVASEARVPNDTNGHNTISYFYSGGKINLQGLGFLGFEQVTESYPFVEKVMKNHYEIKQPYYTPVQNKTEVFNYITNKRLYCDSTVWGVNEYAYKRNRHYVSESIMFDELSNKKTIARYSYDPSSGKPLKTETKYYPSITGTVPEYEKTETYTGYGFRFRNLRTPNSITTVFKKGNETEESTAYYTYDAKGNEIKRVRYKNDPVLELTVNTGYTPTGMVAKDTIVTKSGQKRITVYEYDTKYRWKTKITAPGNFVTQYTYDSKYGNLLNETSVNGLTTSYRYNAWGQLREVTYADGNWTRDTVAWFSSGYSFLQQALYMKTTTSSIAETTRQYYNTLENEVLSSRETENNNTLYSFTQYDASGRIRVQTMPQNVMNVSGVKYYYIQYEYDLSTGDVIREKEYIKQANGTVIPGKRTDVSYTYDYKNRKDTVNNNITGVSTVKQKDLMENIVSVTDPKGTVSYNYSPRGKVLTVNALGTQTTYTYDKAGNRISWNDPNAGTVTYQYNGFQELVSETDAKGTTTTYQYNTTTGQLTGKTIRATSGETENYAYTYGDSGITKGLLLTAANNSHSVTYTYDSYGRKYNIKDKIDGKTFNTNYRYNAYQKLSELHYPLYNELQGFVVKYSYNKSKGNLNRITSHWNNVTLWNKVGMNAYGQTTQVTYGNNLKTTYAYEDEGQRLKRVRSGNQAMTSVVSDWEYTYNRGLIETRTDHTTNQGEEFIYDNALRLVNVVLGNNFGINPQTDLLYDSKDNLIYKSDVGDMDYGAEGKPHALSNIMETKTAQGIHQQLFDTEQCHTEYTPFHKIKAIYNDKGDTLLFTYGVDQQRIKTVLKRRGKETKTTYFIRGLSEYEETPSYRRQRNYVYGDNWAGVNVKDSRFTTPLKDSMYYVFTDHLGSFERITDETGRLLEKQSFDAWGNRRNPGNWSEIDTRTRRLFARGFTGHEHLDDFGLINMNGRLYDPITTQFLSPDPMREDFPNVSPYAYCAHDPINYTDPTGLYLNVSEATWQGRRSLPSATSSTVLDKRMFIEFQNASMLLMGERHYQWLIHEFFKREVRVMISGMNYYEDKSLLGGIGNGILGEAGVIVGNGNTDGNILLASNDSPPGGGYDEATYQGLRQIARNETGLESFKWYLNAIEYKINEKYLNGRGIVERAEGPLITYGQALGNTLPIAWVMNYKAYIESGGQSDLWGNNLNTLGGVNLLLAPFTPTDVSIIIDILNSPLQKK